MDNTFWSEFLLKMANAMIPVLQWALPIMLASFTAVAVQWFRVLEAKLKAEKPTEYAKLEWLCNNAVIIAEQMKLANLIEDKKKWAVDYVQKKVDEQGLKFDVATIEQEIEKAVYGEITKQPVPLAIPAPALPPVNTNMQ
jgi:hypothetical protein